MKTLTFLNGEPNINVLLAVSTFSPSGTPVVSSTLLGIPGTASSGVLREPATFTYSGSNLNSGSSFLARIDSATGSFTIDGRQQAVIRYDGLDTSAAMLTSALQTGDWTIIGSDFDDTWSQGGGDDLYRMGDGDDTAFGLGGDDRLFGDAGNDLLGGGDGRDALDGGAGDDRLSGNDGDDVLRGGSGNDTLNGGRGDDLLVGGEGIDSYDGGDGDDTIDYALERAGVRVEAGASRTASDVESMRDVETVLGSRFADRIAGGQEDNVLNGRGGNDALFGGAGDDNLSGVYGNDILFGGAGDDVLFGGVDDDILLGGGGADVLRGGTGHDVASYTDARDGVRVDLRGVLAGTGDAAGDTFFSIEEVRGTARADIIVGKWADETLEGRAGNDVLIGNFGDDVLRGEAGNDLLVGGAGADTFVMERGGGNDRIRDFDTGADTIDMTGVGDVAGFDDLTILDRPAGTAILWDDDGATNYVVLVGVDPADLAADQFTFGGSNDTGDLVVA